MVGMPVATMRIWERRYAVTAPPTTPTGHRQYSAADVRRLALIRQGASPLLRGHAGGAGVRRAGVTLLRAPIDDDRLAESFSALASVRARRGGSAAAPVATAEPSPIPGAAPPQRRYDDATLGDLAGLSLTIVCECPRHLAEIVMQLSHVEACSRQCQGLDAADAALHAYLGE